MSALSDILLIYSFQFRPAFLPCQSARQHTGILRLPNTIWEVSCTECTGQGNKFELIPTVKMKTRHTIEGYFSSEFPAIYNYCGIMAN